LGFTFIVVISSIWVRGCAEKLERHRTFVFIICDYD